MFGLNTITIIKHIKLQYKALVVNSLIRVGQALELEQKLLGKKLQVVIGLGLMLNNNKYKIVE